MSERRWNVGDIARHLDRREPNVWYVIKKLGLKPRWKVKQTLYFSDEDVEAIATRLRVVDIRRGRVDPTPLLT